MKFFASIFFLLAGIAFAVLFMLWLPEPYDLYCSYIIGLYSVIGIFWILVIKGKKGSKK